MKSNVFRFPHKLNKNKAWKWRVCGYKRNLLLTIKMEGIKGRKIIYKFKAEGSFGKKAT